MQSSDLFENNFAMQNSDWSIYPNFTTTKDEPIPIENVKKICTLSLSQFDTLYDRAVFQKSMKWPLFYTIKVKFLNGDEWQHAWIKKVVEEQIAPLVYPNLFIKFVDTDADVKIQFLYNGIYGESMIGTTCKTTGQNSPSMLYNGYGLDTPTTGYFEYDAKMYKVPDGGSSDSLDPSGNGAVIKHEFGHVFGKWHEHQNPIDNPIKWDAKKVYAFYMKPPPPILTKDQITKNILDLLPIKEADATPFDASSIMLYPIDPSLTTNNIGFDRTFEYSPLDIEWLKYHSVDPQLDIATFDKKYQPNNWGLIVGVGISILLLVVIIYIITSRYRKRKN